MKYVLLLIILYAMPLCAQTTAGDSVHTDTKHVETGDGVNDTITYDPENNMLPNVVVFGHRKDKEIIKAKASKIENQLIGVQASDMSFKPIGLIKYIVGLFKKKHKETKRERMERILREYDQIN